MEENTLQPSAEEVKKPHDIKTKELTANVKYSIQLRPSIRFEMTSTNRDIVDGVVNG